MGFEDVYDSEPTGDDPNGVECKFCGTDGLVWEHICGAGVLVEVGGHRHLCPPQRPRPTDPAEDFKEFL